MTRLVRPLIIVLLVSTTGCAASLMTKAAVANDKLATATRQVQITVEAAHTRDCDLQAPGLQPCLSDAQYKVAREAFIKTATAGLALNDAIRAGNEQGALTQADAALGLVDQLLSSGVVNLPPDDQLIARAVLEAARVALAAVKGGAK